MPSSREEYQEIDLRKAIKFFLKKIWVILGIAIIFSSVALLVSFVIPKTFQVKTVLEIGTILETGIVSGQIQLAPVEDGVQSANKISNDFFGSVVRDNLKIDKREYPLINVKIFSNNFIEISTKSSRVEFAKSVLNELNRAVIDYYEPRENLLRDVVLANIEIKKKDVERLNNKINLAEREKKSLETEISSLSHEIIYNHNTGMELALVSGQRLLETKQQEIESLYLEINQNNSQINIINGMLAQMRPTSVTLAPVVSEYPVSPRILLNVILAGLLGFFMGTFFVFVAKWWKKQN